MKIKFRARIKENGKPKMFYQNDQYLNSFLRRVSGFLYFEKDGEEKHEAYLGDYEMEKSLDMFTGIIDKNGKEIYEGDIVKHSPPNISFHDRAVEVKWDDYVFGWLFGKSSAPHYVDDYIEVIGNIYENPNLL